MPQTTLPTPLADARLLARVETELRWVPAVDASRIGVSVAGSVVTLAGTVPSFRQVGLAGAAVRRVRGVSTLAQELTVRTAWADLDDTDVAGEVRDALHRHVEVPDSVRAGVTHGVVTLTGEVDWHYQQEAACGAVRVLRGVDGVVDEVVVRPRVHGGDVRHEITRALARNAAVEVDRISVVVEGRGTVRLEGTVRSWAERRGAEHAAWCAAGVTTVRNHLAVEL